MNKDTFSRLLIHYRLQGSQSQSWLPSSVRRSYTPGRLLIYYSADTERQTAIHIRDAIRGNVE